VLTSEGIQLPVGQFDSVILAYWHWLKDLSFFCNLYYAIL
jgi:hypothetical protein